MMTVLTSNQVSTLSLRGNYPHISQEIMNTIPSLVNDITDKKQVLDDLYGLERLATTIYTKIVEPFATQKMYHKFYEVDIEKYDLDGKEYTDLTIIRRRLPRGAYKSEVSCANRQVANVKRPSVQARFEGDRIVLLTVFGVSHDGRADADQIEVFDHILSTKRRIHYSNVVRFLMKDILEELSESPVAVKVRESKAQKRKRVAAAKKAIEKEKRLEEKRILAEQKAERARQRAFNALCCAEVRDGKTIEVPEFDANNIPTGRTIKIAQSGLEQYMSEHGRKRVEK